MVLSLLSKNERAYLAGSKEFTAKQRRDIRYRLSKKMKYSVIVSSVGPKFSITIGALRTGYMLPLLSYR